MKYSEAFKKDINRERCPRYRAECKKGITNFVFWKKERQICICVCLQTKNGVQKYIFQIG